MAPGLLTNNQDLQQNVETTFVKTKRQLSFAAPEKNYGAVTKDSTHEQPVEDRRSELYGYALMILGCFFFDIVSTVGRATMIFHGLSSANFIFLRGTSHVVYCILWTFAFYDWREVFYVPPEMRGLLFIRAALGGIAIALCYYALSMTPLVVIVSVLFLGKLHYRLLFYEFTNSLVRIRSDLHTDPICYIPWRAHLYSRRMRSAT